MSKPTEIRATLRLQLHRDFGFDAARAQLPYLAALGVSHLYLSPILTARSGSLHGYDVVDHGAINPELGGEAGFRALVAATRERGMGVIVDIVPNHMAVGEHDNAWWLDVLEWGRDSRYAAFFDIDWDVDDPALHGRLCAPFLGKPYGEALADGELALSFDAARGRLYVAYYDHHFPLAPQVYAPLLRSGGGALADPARVFHAALARRGRAARWSAFDDARAALAAAAQRDDVRAALDALLARYRRDEQAGAAGDARRREQLHRLCERQHWRLAWWRTAADEINWRRFFDVISLAALRADEGAVFEATHALVFRLYAEGLIDGVRIDHIDGLADPRAYCRRLRARLTQLQAQRPQALRGEPYIVAEKILAPREKLARDWRLDGTSGYVFMNEVSAVLHDRGGAGALSALWSECSGYSGNFEQEAERARRRIPQELFAADFEACARSLHRIARLDPLTRDWTLAAIRRVLAELLAHFPVYRTYVDARGRSQDDAAIMRKVSEAARASCRPAERALVEQIDRWLSGVPAGAGNPQRQLHRRAIARFQQLTPPVAAKSIEDTAFYRYGVLVSRNEVGADPAHFAISVEAFHHACRERLRRFPRAMLATATHDHKRGEDLRARLALLSAMPGRWAELVSGWRALNAQRKPVIDGVRGPDATDEYILYQMLVGAWPPGLRGDDAEGRAQFCARLAAWQEKAAREAKRRSGWAEPNLAYERAALEFLEALLGQHGDFVAQLVAFVESIGAAGAVNGLAQTALRLTTPGVPDTYQGCEFWDFSLVDPDNRRPVDYAARSAALASRDDDATLLRHWHDGRVKQRLIARLLQLRAAQPALFGEKSSYMPLAVEGARGANLIAFARQAGSARLVVVVPRLPQALLDDSGALTFDPARWADTAVRLPAGWRDLRWTTLDGDSFSAGAQLAAAQRFGRWPLAVLHAA
ncbi:malto-oligosyltrehalose synthase [Solimonas soli]|uniref:malto-oligosyltrehalose synthase n=1 Tax=Solimonas soli TaxID=413479 RepID=UPI000481A246|nr:malto-oligosyltrehalose synthase [Solimonas soli]